MAVDAFSIDVVWAHYRRVRFIAFLQSKRMRSAIDVTATSRLHVGALEDTKSFQRLFVLLVAISFTIHFSAIHRPPGLSRFEYIVRICILRVFHLGPAVRRTILSTGFYRVIKSLYRHRAYLLTPLTSNQRDSIVKKCISK